MTDMRENQPVKTSRSSIRRKSLFSILLIALVLSVTSIVIGFTVYANTMNDHYIQNTVHLARTAAAVLDSSQLAHYIAEVKRIYSGLTEDEKSDEQLFLSKYAYMESEADWQLLRSQLQAIHRENELDSVMVVTVVDSNTAIYIVDSDESETYCPPGTMDTLTDDDIDSFTEGRAVISNTEEFGWLSSGGAPFRLDDGTVAGFVVIDISMNDVMQDRQKFLLSFCLILIAVTAVLCALATWLMRRQVVTPVKKLTAAAEAYSNDRSHGGQDEAEMQKHFSSLDIHTGDELENLSNVMGEMETRIAGYIENLTRVTAEKERISAELNVATQIQADMLPRIFPAFPDRREFDLYATMNPAKEVGGDFYDFFLVDDDHIALVVADVSGKGVPAALFMVIAKTLIKNQTLLGNSPAEVLSNVNEQLCEGNDAELFVTVWLAVIEISTGKGIAANAGHEHPVIRRAGGRYELSLYRHSPAVATMKGIPFRQHDFELHPGDELFIYTDGVPEATNEANELFGSDRMLESLNRCTSSGLQDLLRSLRSDIDRFVGNAPQFDDITMLGFRYFGNRNLQ